MILKLHIPEHNCEQHKMVVGTGASHKEGFIYWQCGMCNRRWEEKSPVVKTTRFEIGNS